MHELFERRARIHPDGVAVDCEGTSHSYSAVDQWADAIATRLVGAGVAPEMLVAICAERSIETLVGLLAILKAGGAFLPLDVDYPPDRLRFMLEDSRCALVLATREASERLPDTGARFVAIDGPDDEGSGDRSVRTRAVPENLAYVIYTSGSSGQPKGVMVEHRSLVNVVLAGGDHMRLGPADRVQQFSSLSWDVGVGEVLTTWAAGACLVVSTQSLLSVSDVLALAEQRESTVISLPTAYWRRWAADAPTARRAPSPSIRLVGFGGEKAEAKDVQLWNRWVGIPCFNGYGPTETCINSTVYYIPTADECPSVVPIGKPIANTATYVLDEHLNPVSPGARGELVIGGVGVARGYLNLPELTSERFIASPFDESGEERLYRTGDVVRCLPDGNIEFLTRTDYQVKVRGFRVEPGEIEAVLGVHPDLHGTVVLAREDTPGERQLVAYVVSNRDGDVSAGALRQWLRKRLPGYMVPSAFVFLPAFPLSPNGKIDRQALPAPGISRRDQYERILSPATATEEALVAIWAEVLGVDAVSVDDDFFDLGGSSLNGLQVVARARDVLGREIPLRMLFDFRTLREIARSIDGMGEEGESAPTPVLEPVERGNLLPLSFSQERLWFLDQLSPGSPMYNIPTAYRLAGPLDAGMLRSSVNEVVARHEALRTTFVTVGGRPFQKVASALSIEVECTDLIGQDQAGDQIEQVAYAEARQPFDLARGPLIRVRLIRRAPDEHLLLITTHHIVSDAWSVAVLMGELSCFYRVLARAETPSMPPLPIQYVDFAAWQRRCLDHEAERQLAYWTSTLATAPPALGLPADRPRPPRPSYDGGTLDFEVPRSVAVALEALGRECRASLFMTLLAAFDVLLGRYTGSDDIIVGTPVAGRRHSDLEELIGLFVNTIPLRADVSGDPTFLELLDQVRETTLGALAHQDVPFERLVLELNPLRDLARNPIVQVLFQLLPAAGGAPLDFGEKVACIDLSALRGPDQPGLGGAMAPFDLHLLMAALADGSLAGRVIFSTELFDHATIERLVRHFVTLLEAVARDPEPRLSSLDVPAPEDRSWSTQHPPDARECSLHRLVEEQVDLRPAALALLSERGSLTYGELDDRANRLARHLRGLGVGPEVVVGIFVDRSPEVAIGILAILKAGAAVLPLDPCLPEERLAFMLEDSAVAVVLSQERLRHRLPAEGRRVVSLDGDWRDIARCVGDRLSQKAGLDDLAYVIYTSGSTGRPKGVMLSHRGLVNHNRAMVELYGLGPGDRVLQFCSMSFDVSVQEMFTGWASGATVVFRPDSLPILGQEWLRWLQRQHVTVLTLPTSYWHEWIRDLQAMNEAVPDSVRLTFVAGEKALRSAYQAWLGLVRGRVRWINGYGPTEASVIATVYEPPSGQVLDRDPPIGRPIAEVTVRLLDHRGRPVPVGVPGELYIGGVGLARGYLGRPELTARVFTPYPDRLYRTGDIARLMPDGDLEYVGRTDRQLKIQGFRVEPDEIEATLMGQGAVEQAIVVARQDSRDESCLVGYVVVSDHSIDQAGLRHILVERLPAYMVPHAFVILDAFPLTANGKVDRDALPPPDLWSVDVVSSSVKPATPMAKKMASIWVRLLGVEGIGLNSNFFDLGGHSLLATQLMAHVREVFNADVPLSAIFETPTVAGLVAAVEEATPDCEEFVPPLVPQPRGCDEHIPLALPQEQMWTLEMRASPPSLYNLTIYHRFNARVDADTLQSALNHIVERHEILRTSFGSEDGTPFQVVAPSVAVNLEVSDLSQVPALDQEESLLARIGEENARPFDLGVAPLLCSRLFLLGYDASTLVVTFDHLVCDGASAFYFLEEVLVAYKTLKSGHRLALIPVEVHYADFALWQRRLSTSDRLEAQLEYWKRRLDGMPLGPAIPFDHCPDIPTRRIGRRYIEVSPETYGRLARLARASQSTVFVVSAAAVAVLSSAYDGQSDIVLSTTLSGRHLPELESMVGMFAGMSRMRVDVSGDPSFCDVLGRARETILGMLENQELPFMRVRARLFPDWPRDGVGLSSVLPNEFVYFRIPVVDGEPDSGPGERQANELYIRGQLHPLSFTLLDDGRKLWGHLSYKLDWYSEHTIEHLARGLEWLLATVGCDSGLSVSGVQDWLQTLKPDHHSRDHPR